MIPDFFEAITAYRAFNVFDNGLLVGQAHAEPWPTYQAFIGRCGMVSGNGWKAHLSDAGFVGAPVKGCDCGVHALKSESAAEGRILDDRDGTTTGWMTIQWQGADDAPHRAWGEVKLWGRIIEHELGYRAEFAYPSKLYTENAALAPKIAALYGVPCEVKKLAPRQLVPHDNWYIGTWNIPLMSPFVSILDDATVSPMIHAPMKQIAPPSIVQATRWQQRQYAKAVTGPAIQSVDYRQMLRKMIYLNP